MGEKKKILLIAGDNACFNALNDFAVSFSYELNEKGYETEIKNLDVINEQILTEMITGDHKAVVGFQTNLFTLRLDNGKYIGELLPMPKFNFVFDPPASKLSFFSCKDRSLKLLLSDHGYIDFIRRYYKDNNEIYYLPPGGGIYEEVKYEPDHKARDYGLTFMGTYIDYRDILNQAVNNMPDFADLILDFFQYMQVAPNKSAESSAAEFIADKGIILNREEFLQLIEILYISERAVMSYYREKIIRSFLTHGIDVDVFSASWKAAPFADDQHIHIHESVSYRDSMEYLRKSKLSLNVFSWHKNAMTERIANIMLGGAVCVSDRSEELERLFRNEEDIVMFDLTDIDEAAVRVKNLLKDDDRRIRIARSGYENAYKNHRWRNRVEEFIRILGS